MKETMYFVTDINKVVHTNVSETKSKLQEIADELKNKSTNTALEMVKEVLDSKINQTKEQL